MASQRSLPCRDTRKALQIILQCEGESLVDLLRDVALRTETKPVPKKSSRQTQKGDTTMYDYEFGYRGGAKKLDKANYKFHVFVADTNATEHHMYGALKNGLIGHRDSDHSTYGSATPVVKVFTATAGFGVPKEFFSYFIMLSGTSGKVINLKPLGFKNLKEHNWFFSGRGRFMSKEEVRRFFGADSDTWKFYQRQSFLSRTRLQELVSITEGDVTSAPVEDHEEVRMLRFD